MSSPPQEPVQQADGERITGACRVYLVGWNCINVQFAGGSIRIGTFPSPGHYHPLEPLTRYGAHGLKYPCRCDIVVLRL